MDCGTGNTKSGYVAQPTIKDSGTALVNLTVLVCLICVHFETTLNLLMLVS